jgi:poly(3-hydroxybutyrate) depolymerase
MSVRLALKNRTTVLFSFYLTSGDKGMNTCRFTLGALATALVLAGCGGGTATSSGTQDTSGARGSLLQNPPVRVTALTAADFTASLNASATGKGLLQVAGSPTCGIDVQYLQYGTVGGKDEKTTASGVLMTPTGTDAKCSGARPIVLYAHGTNISKSFNMAALNDAKNPAYGEAVLVAAMYAAQGYIVVAPNYAGYDSSTLDYHPYLNADQQSKEMIDILAAAKKAMPTLLTPKTDNGKLFITGYSQGGHVAMATHRAMQAAGTTVTAAAPMSGPYALAAQADSTYYGLVNAGGTIFTPLISTSFQKAYGNLYTTPSDIYESAYATGIETLMPGAYDFTSIVTSGKLPQLQLFSSTPPTAPAGSPAIVQGTINGSTPYKSGTAVDALFAAGFGTNNLIKNSARLAYLLDAMANPDGTFPTASTGVAATNPQNPLRIAGKKNDLRGWKPTSPVLLCGGNADPTVFYNINTQGMQRLWANPASPLVLPTGLLTVLDVDSTPTGATDPFAAAKGGFALAKKATADAAGTDPVAQATAVTSAYHGSLVPPFCNAAARGFFSQF